MPDAAKDVAVRCEIFRRAAAGRVPLIGELAASLALPVDAVAASVTRLAEAHALVQQPDGEILMAEPFSAVPTAFAVTAGGRSWWAACIWDALGIPAMLKADAQIETSCQCCGQRLPISVAGGTSLQSGQGVAHFLVRAAHWWDDIVFT
jgi:Alkylmercury lyase